MDYSDQDQIQRLLDSNCPCVHIPTTEEMRALMLVRDSAMSLPVDTLQWSIISGLTDALINEDKFIKETEHPAAALYHLAQRNDRYIAVMLDLIPHLNDPRTLRALREAIMSAHSSYSSIILIDSQHELPPAIRSHANSIHLQLPNADTIEQIVRSCLNKEHKKNPIEVDISRSSLDMFVRNMLGLSRSQIESIVAETVAEDRRFDASDINFILARKRQILQSDGLLEYVKAPTSLDRIGGMTNLKHWLKLRQQSDSSQAQTLGIKPPRGVLMLGVQGAGKSLCAKAIATAWNRPLLRLDPGVLFDKFVGESERRLRSALAQAEAMAPIVLWIDEIEKAFASAASQSTDGGLSRRMFGSLLTWMQEHKAPVFLVATANDIKALPPELLRKGRFDEIFFVDLPDHDTRQIIARIHLEKRKQNAADFDLGAIADASEGFSGAEIEQGIIASLYAALNNARALTTQDVAASLAQSPPLSVTMAEQVHALRAWARDRCVPAD